MARRRLGIFRRASSEEEGVEAPAPDSNGDATRDDAATEEHESAPEGTATATEDLGEKEPASDTGVLPAATTDDFSPPHGLFDQETAGVAARSESSDRPEDFQSPDALPPATEPASDTAAEEPTGEWQVLASSEGHGSPVAGGDEDEPRDFAPPDAGGNSPTTVAETPDPFPASVQAEADTEARRSDTAERIRLAAASAAQAAEERAIDEILALEEDLERAKTDASSRVQALEDQVADAQTLEEKARAGAAAWLRSQMKDLNRVIEGFDLRLSEIEERALAAADRVAAAAEELAAEAERLRETADRRVAEETERAQGEANEAADDSISEPEAELDEAEA
jgi:hypothetical protein